MNSLEIIVNSVFFTINQFYKAFLWSLHIIEKANHPSLETEPITSFQLEPPFLQIQNTSLTSSKTHHKVLVAIAVITCILHIVKTLLRTEFVSGDDFIVNRVRTHALRKDESQDFMSGMDNISWYYPNTTIGFNGSSLRDNTIMDKPSDILIWDSKFFNPI